jgi:hypothetical protein
VRKTYLVKSLLAYLPKYDTTWVLSPDTDKNTNFTDLVRPNYLKSPDDVTIKLLFNYQKRYNNQTMIIIFDDVYGYPAFEKSKYAPQLFVLGRQQRISVILISHTANHAPRPIIKKNKELSVFRLLQQQCKRLPSLSRGPEQLSPTLAGFSAEGIPPCPWRT